MLAKNTRTSLQLTVVELSLREARMRLSQSSLEPKTFINLQGYELTSAPGGSLVLQREQY